MVDSGIIHRLASQAQAFPIYHDKRFPPSVYYRFLRLLTAEVKSDLSVELGVCGGGASLHMALGWPDGAVVGIDHREEYPGNIAYVRDVCDNFTFYQYDSVEFADRYIAMTEDMLESHDRVVVSVLFIDTVHTYERTMAEFNAWQPLLADDAVVVLDDLFRDGMQQAWDELPGEKIRLDDLHIGGSPTDGGFGVLLL